jgi:hypothetical protein
VNLSTRIRTSPLGRKLLFAALTVGAGVVAAWAATLPGPLALALIVPLLVAVMTVRGDIGSPHGASLDIQREPSLEAVLSTRAQPVERVTIPGGVGHAIEGGAPSSEDALQWARDTAQGLQLATSRIVTIAHEIRALAKERADVEGALAAVARGGEACDQILADLDEMSRQFSPTVAAAEEVPPVDEDDPLSLAEAHRQGIEAHAAA